LPFVVGSSDDSVDFHGRLFVDVISIEGQWRPMGAAVVTCSSGTRRG
jgi:hypothetical protein